MIETEVEYDPAAADADHWYESRADREADQDPNPMGMMKHYYLGLLTQCSEEQTGQDAIEWAIITGLIKLTYRKEQDLQNIMARYSEIIVAYQHHLATEGMTALMQAAVDPTATTVRLAA